MADDNNVIELATELTVAWLANPNTRVASEDVPAFLSSMHDSLGKLASGGTDQAAEPATEEHVPAVSARKSLASPDHIISMIDGKKYKALKRHLTTNGLTPAQYRERYNLKPDYPMVAPAYSEARSATAKRLGLGRKPGPKPGAAAASKAKAAPKSRESESPAKV